MSNLRGAVHCFGKLPIAGDFIRYRLDGDEVRAFAIWMERGHLLVESVRRSRTPEEEKPGAGSGRRYRFAFDLGLQKLIVGVLHESHDRGMLRRFPFAYYASLDARGFRNRPALMPWLLSEAWGQMERDIGTLESAEEMDALFQRLDEARVEVSEPSREAGKDLDRYFSETRAGDFWARLLPGENAERRIELFTLLVQALYPFRKKRPEEIPVAFKLPLAGTVEDAAAQGAFWVQLLTSMLKSARQAPKVFLESPSGSGPPSALYVFFQPPEDRNFASLMSKQVEEEYVNDLADLAVKPASSPMLGSGSVTVLREDGSRLAELLKHRWM